MDLKRFKKLHKVFSDFPISRALSESPEAAEYQNEIGRDTKCGNWYLKQAIQKAKIDYRKYCCLSMAYHLIEDRKNKDRDAGISSDSVITHTKKSLQYGIPIHDGGTSFIAIRFCPWCGKKLKPKT